MARAKPKRSVTRGARKAPRSAVSAKPSPAKPAKSAKSAKSAADLEPTRLLGEVTAPSGTLAILDLGLASYLPRDALAPTIVTVAVPADRALPVIAIPSPLARTRWDHVAIQLDPSPPIASRKPIGAAAVDFGRLACLDLAAFEHWQADEPLDGRADVVFTGRDAKVLAEVSGARRLADGYGWVNMPFADADVRCDELRRRKAANRWLLEIELRPHSHNFLALAALRASATGAGALEVAGSRMLMFGTTWGDQGAYPVFLDRDHAGMPVQIRIQLAAAT